MTLANTSTLRGSGNLKLTRTVGGGRVHHTDRQHWHPLPAACQWRIQFEVAHPSPSRYLLCDSVGRVLSGPGTSLPLPVAVASLPVNATIMIVLRSSLDVKFKLSLNQ